MGGLEGHVQGMVLVRLFSALAELTGAYLMFRFNRLETAVRINALLGLVGPVVLITATTIGVVGLAGKLSAVRIFMIFAGVGLILAGVRQD